MAKYKNSKYNLEGLLPENLERNAEIMHSTFLRTINSAVISLFWEIGSLINKNPKYLLSNDGGNFEINLISNHLMPVFGAYMTQENLLLMRRFAVQCNEVTMREVSHFINWNYIPILLELGHNDAWLYYAHYIHKESLSPEQLQKKIKTHSFKISANNNPQERILSLMLNESKVVHQNSLNLYFSEITGGMFQNLFEPKLESKLNFDSLMKEEKPDLELMLQIYAGILEFQSRFNYILNNLFNGFCYGIGDEILRIANIFNTLVTDSLLDHCIAELGENFPYIFNRGHLLDCLKFAEHFKDYRQQRNELQQTVSWPYITILNKIDSIDKQLCLAQKVFKEGISIEVLRKMIVDGSFDSKRLENSQVKEIIGKNSAEVEKTKRRNYTLTVTKEVHEPRISSENDINRNIFKNPDILNFLQAQ